MILTALSTLAALALGVGEPAAGSALAASPAEAKMKVERLKQEIAQEEKAWADELAREKEAEARRKQRLADFNADRHRLQQTLAEQEIRLKGLIGRMEAHQYREKELKARFLALNEVLAAQAKILKSHLAGGLPYRLDKRMEIPGLLARDIEGGNISPEEGMNRLWAFHQSERRMAQEAEVFSGDLIQDGSADAIQVKYLRIGKQFLAYTSLDGTRVGILKPGRGPEGSATYEWVREDRMDHAMKQAVKAAIATAEGTSVPGFVPLPVWNLSFASAGAVGMAERLPAAAAPSAGRAEPSAPARRAAP